MTGCFFVVDSMHITTGGQGLIFLLDFSLLFWNSGLFFLLDFIVSSVHCSFIAKYAL